MRQMALRLRWIVGYLLLTVVVSGCNRQPSEEEKQTVSKLTTDMATQGLGRYLIDLPSTWRYGSGGVTLYYGLGTDFKTVRVSVIDQAVTPAQFQAAIDWRAQRLKGVTNEANGAPMLVGAWALDVQVDGDTNRRATLLRYYESEALDNYHTHEIHLLLGATYVLLKADSYKGVIGPVEDRLKTLAKQIFVIRDPARAGPGFILGPILIRGTQDHEVGNVTFYDPQRRDVTLEIYSSAVTPDGSRDLLQRAGEGMHRFRQHGASLHTLRKGDRAFAGMRGQEYLATSDSKSNDGRPLHAQLYAAETYRPQPGLMQPTLSPQLNTGDRLAFESDEVKQARKAAPGYFPRMGLPSFIVRATPARGGSESPVSSSLSDYEATALWDAILPTIRPRPDAVPPSRPKDWGPSPISREQAEADRRALDEFLASEPDGKPGRAGG